MKLLSMILRLYLILSHLNYSFGMILDLPKISKFVYRSFYNNLSHLKCQAVLLLRPDGLQNDYYLANIHEQMQSNINTASYTDNNTFDIHVNYKITSITFDCIIIINEERRLLHNITDILDKNKIYWDYTSHIIFICKYGYYQDQTLFNENSEFSFNGMILHWDKALGYKVCGSSKRIYQFDVNNPEIRTIVKKTCEINFHGQSIPVLLTHNPPMADFKGLTDKEKETKMGMLKCLDELEGLEVSFLQSLESRFNMSINIVSPNLSDSFSYVRQGERFVLSYRPLETGDIKILGNTHAHVLLPINSNIKFTFPLYYEKACIIVDKSLMPTKILNIFKIFEWPVYLGILITAIVVAMLWMTISKYMHVQKKDYGVIILMVILMMSNGSVYRILNSKSEKILVLGFLFFNLVILNIFQGNLINVFNELDDYREYTEFRNFVELDIPVLPFRREMASFYGIAAANRSESYRKHALQISKGLLLSGKENYSVGYIISDFDKWIVEGFAILSLVSTAKRKIIDIMAHHHSTELLMVDDSDYVPTGMTLVMNSDIKISPYINQHVMELTTSNLLVKWYEKTVNENMRRIIAKLTISKDNHALSLKEFEMCFILYGIGILFSCTIFITEMLRYNVTKKTLRRNFVGQRSVTLVRISLGNDHMHTRILARAVRRGYATKRSKNLDENELIEKRKADDEYRKEMRQLFLRWKQDSNIFGEHVTIF